MNTPSLLKTAYEVGLLLAMHEAGVSPNDFSKSAGWWNSFTEAIGAGGAAPGGFKQFLKQRTANPAMAARESAAYNNILRSKSMIARTNGQSSASGGRALGYYPSPY